ncbi:FixH family protein [Oceanicaulis sp.]|jgi:nitrogen fixation protein FixH|uniref:FixH family protein n=1 Tax=Oceanicaulis sp. TaxID=1924941 RepID=UPI003F728679
MTDLSATEAAPGFRIKGWHVLAAMIMFFSVIIGVNTVFITLAMRSFPGEDQRRSYVQGLEYNDIIAQRRAQAALGWTAAVNLAEDRVLIRVTDAEDAPVMGLALDGVLRHPASTDLDHVLVFSEARPGVYSAPVEDLPLGSWTLHAEAVDADAPFVLERELWRR